MDISDFKRVLSSFADEPTDVDIRLGRVVAQLRDDIIDATISFDPQDNGRLIVHEDDQRYDARLWLVNRVAKLPQLADRILSNVPSEPSPNSPFVVPSGDLSADISSAKIDDVPVADVVESMRASASNPVPGATTVLYITSDAGEGKTTVINRAALEQAKKFKLKEVSSLIVPIPLSGRAFLTFDDAVIAALVNKLRFNYWYYDAFLNLVKMGLIVPAFDGYEEMLVEGSKGEAVSALGNLVQTLDSAGTIFIAARKAFFEYLSFKTQARLLDAIGDRSASFARLELRRWDEGQFLEYGRLRGVADAKGIYDTVAARLSCEHPLLTRAVLVRRLFDVASEASDRSDLLTLLGHNPSDYFHTFVDAIVKREATEKWLARVSGEIMEPLLETVEHHMLLSQIALEMWQLSVNCLRYDVLDVVVEIFAESRKKSARVIRQIKERIRQHSLLSADSAKGNSVCFDHEDFQNFYLGEGLGHLVARRVRSELSAFLSINVVPPATVEQAVQYLIRDGSDLALSLQCVQEINDFESSFSFCKENCGMLGLRLAECLASPAQDVFLRNMFFSSGALAGRKLQRVTFEGCHFQSTTTQNASFEQVRFIECEFEQLEGASNGGFGGWTFENCKIDCLLLTPEDQQSFDPSVISALLERSGGNMGMDSAASQLLFPEDDRLRVLEKFLRIFLRCTYVDESFIKVRLGKVHAPIFFDSLLSELLSVGVLEEIPWKGQGVQRRYKLGVSMSDVNRSLERSRGSFDAFLREIGPS
ncbi:MULTISPECIES: hypothetical protein [unclassified Rhodanobacter]|uniref:hypothetical protein n=1 Tax=unclassified Rhodanobacter TaxID=2621553 RepID=UPI000AF0BC4F|nr:MULTISPECIES: hypothetical protein [unclassified Rhodanobacter]